MIADESHVLITILSDHRARLLSLLFKRRSDHPENCSRTIVNYLASATATKSSRRAILVRPRQQKRSEKVCLEDFERLQINTYEILNSRVQNN